MATAKRKAVTDERPSKRVKPTKEASKHVKDVKAKAEDPSERRPASKSILQTEERAFPRGGASVLTPLEQKQIRNQAERDVLFEQQTGKPAANDDPDLVDGEEAEPAPKSKKGKKWQQNGGSGKKPEKPSIKVHGLSYKNLVVGSAVLGYVTAITSRDVALALANNLTGYARITAASTTLNGRIERLLGDAEGDDDAEDEADVDLQKLFHVGQWLRATVTATGAESTGAQGKSKRHIELSLDPAQTNAGLEADNVVVNSMLQAAVRSVEDHGLIMDLGLGNANVKGFVSKKELGVGYKMDEVQEGQVMMCVVTGKGSNGQVLKLSPDAARFAVVHAGKSHTGPFVTDAPVLESFQPGTAVDVLITENVGGVAGKVMGMLDVTADFIHSGTRTKDEDLTKKYKIGSKIKARIIWTLPADDGARRVGVSTQDHLMMLPPPPARLPDAASAKLRSQAAQLVEHLPISSIVEDARIVDVRPERGLHLQLPSITGNHEKAAQAFAHISQISDTRIDTLSASTGQYRVDSTHRVRIIAYNPVDNLYYVSLKESTLEQQFLRLQDVQIGEVVKGTVEKLVLGAKGINGALVKLSEHVTGYVPDIHLSDVRLSHPERKYKEGLSVKARVLDVDLNKRHLRLTLKKTLVNDEEVGTIWKDYTRLESGMESKGTIVNLLPSGAAVQFFGNVRAWLPIAEMSETFVTDTKAHFRAGQTVNVRILSVNADTLEMKVSCKAANDFDEDQQEAWETLSSGQIVSGKVSEKSADSLTVELDNGLRGVVRIGHLTDASAERAEKTLKKAQVGQTMSDLVVLQKLERSKAVSLSKKPTLVEAGKSSSLIASFVDVSLGSKVSGFVRNVTREGVYVEFANNTVGLLPKSQISQDLLHQPAFGLRKDQTIAAWVSHVDDARERFTLTMHEPSETAQPTTKKPETPHAMPLTGSADPKVTSSADYQLGKVTKARVASVKATQLNVRLADNVQGRVDVSEAFDSYDEIKNKKAPLVDRFKAGDVIDVKILGIHDARHHRFLPISHRGSSVPVFELSAKKSRIQSGSDASLIIDSVKEGSEHLAFVNNHANQGVWVNISPNVRGRIARMDLSDDSSAIMNPEGHFPIGCAVRVTVKHVDAASNKLELSAKTDAQAEPLTLQTVKPGMIVAGRITKISERSLTVQISETLAAPVPLTELGDDYDELNLSRYQKNEIVRVCVMDVDLPNKKLYASLRPSKVLSSSLPVKDPQVTTYSQLKVNDKRRGFVRHVAEKGIVVSLGSRVDAFVQIRDLSDQYVKDWKTLVEVDKLVAGRVIKVDADGRYAQMSLKASALEEDYKAPITFADLQVGMTVTGKVRKVEDFGAFVDIDGTQPRLSGLCHRSEVADQRVQDVRKVYSEGDKVKARVLSVDAEKRRIGLGLKASYFVDGADEESGDDEDMEDAVAGAGEEHSDDADADGVELDALAGLRELEDEESDEDEGGVDLADVLDIQSDGSGDEAEGQDSDMMDVDDAPAPTKGLKTAGFDWTGDAFEPAANGAASDSEVEAPMQKKRKRRPEIKEDLTGDLDKYGPRSADDFERQLLGQPNDSGLWIQYMAFQLQLSEIQKARDIAERALRTIHIRETDEKGNVWIARMNLEVEYGSEEEVEEVFKRACQVQDPLEMHEKLASIYIDSGKHGKADEVFDKIVGNKTFRASPDVWLNYANFLMDTLKDSARARALLTRALKSIPSAEHRQLTAKFAAMEFRSEQGDTERGRTIFEGLVAEWPKWTAGWDMFVDLERAHLARAETAEAKAEAVGRVRELYERVVAQKMKKRRAKFVFKKWLEFENKEGSEKTVERVTALAKEWVEEQQARSAAAAAGAEEGEMEE